LNKELFPNNRFTVSLDLEGNYQSKNIVTALTSLAVLKKQSFEIAPEAEQEGLSNTALNTSFKGRWQILNRNPTIICDSGHNAHGLNLTMKQLKELKYDNLYFVLGLVGDKDLDSVIPLLPENAYYFFTQASIPRAMKAELLAEKCRQSGLCGEIVDTVADAVQKAIAKAGENDVVFIGGSTYVVGEGVRDLKI
jgi:dihydrofolate synthase/folylpolyglutamate synthase